MSILTNMVVVSIGDALANGTGDQVGFTHRLATPGVVVIDGTAPCSIRPVADAAIRPLIDGTHISADTRIAVIWLGGADVESAPPPSAYLTLHNSVMRSALTLGYEVICLHTPIPDTVGNKKARRWSRRIGEHLQVTTTCLGADFHSVSVPDEMWRSPLQLTADGYQHVADKINEWLFATPTVLKTTPDVSSSVTIRAPDRQRFKRG